ncbi:MAG: hypothetical protein U5R06_03600 [candidate division KSB1 bacterium]|nr:hypothetical protein [candidate division KSB1 bacterium]
MPRPLPFRIDMQSQYSGLSGSDNVSSYYYYMRSNNLRYYQALLSSAPFREQVIREALSDSTLNARGGIRTETIQQILNSGLTLSKPEEYSNLMNMRLTAYDPVVCYRIAVIAADAFKQRSRNIEQEQSQNVVEYVESQKREAEKNLEKAETELQEFKNETNITISDASDGILQRLNEIESRITEIETKRRLAEENLKTYNLRLAQMQGKSSPGMLDMEAPHVKELRMDIQNLEEQIYQLQEAGDEGSEDLTRLQTQLSTKKDQLRAAVLQAGEGEQEPVLGADDNTFAVLRERKINEELELYSLKNEERFYKQLLRNYQSRHPQCPRARHQARQTAARQNGFGKFIFFSDHTGSKSQNSGGNRHRRRPHRLSGRHARRAHSG